MAAVRGQARGIYYGWYVVATAMAISAFLVGSTFSAFGVFVIPISAELMLSRADMNTALIFKNLGNAVFAPIIGRLLDRINTRLVMIVCSGIFAISFVTLGMSHSLWLGALVMGVGVPIAYLGAGSLTNTLLIARWFRRRRARAMLLAGLGLSLGSVIGAPAAGFLVEAHGWRIALIIIGLVVGAALTALALVVRIRPGPDDLETAGEAESAVRESAPDRNEGTPLGIADMLRSPYFWTMCLATAVCLGPNQALIISLIPLGQESGLSTMQAASLMSVLGAVSVVSALCFSIVADRVNKVVVLACLIMLEASVNAALLFDKGYMVLFACAAVIGLVGGTLVHTFYALLADRFGTASFGTVRGASFTLIGISGMIAVRYSGEVYDRTGGYDFMFGTFILTHTLAAALMLSTLIVDRRRRVSGMAESAV
jgi:predicted MFS family arabinose efflux permease